MHNAVKWKVGIIMQLSLLFFWSWTFYLIWWRWSAIFLQLQKCTMNIKKVFKQKILLVILLVVLLRKHHVNLYFYVDLLFLAYLHEKGSVCPHKHPRKGNENHKKCTYQNQTIRMFGFNFTSACFITSH